MANEKVLVVDDNDTLCKVLIKVLQSWGMVPSAAASIQEAREKTSKNIFDFVIWDGVQPGMDAGTFSKEIKKGNNANALSVIVTPIGRSLQKELQVDGWLTKPIKPFELRNLLIELLSPDKVLKMTALASLHAKGKAKDHQSLRILMAEDNPVNQKVALMMLERLGYSADVAVNGLEVLRALEKQPYDVVLMDVQMPEMDGLEATRRLRSSGIKARIIAMTAYALDGDREKCLSAGMDEYISKPIKIGELDRALERSSNKGSNN